MSTQPTAPAAILVSPDLLFAGKVQAAAGPLGMRVVQETEPARIENALAEHSVSIVLLDLNVTSPSLDEVMAALPAEARPMVVAFGPHVNTVRLEAARRAGCDRVLPRSRFVAELPELLQTALKNS